MKMNKIRTVDYWMIFGRGKVKPNKLGNIWLKVCVFFSLNQTKTRLLLWTDREKNMTQTVFLFLRFIFFGGVHEQFVFINKCWSLIFCSSSKVWRRKSVEIKSCLSSQRVMIYDCVLLVIRLIRSFEFLVSS